MLISCPSLVWLGERGSGLRLRGRIWLLGRGLSTSLSTGQLEANRRAGPAGAYAAVVATLKRPTTLSALIFLVATFLTPAIVSTANWSLAQRGLWLLILLGLSLGLGYIATRLFAAILARRSN